VVDGVGDPDGRTNRNAEHDAFDERYVTLLVEEIIPEVTRRWSITDDHDRWGIGGLSSGGSCAFTAAWLRPMSSDAATEAQSEPRRRPAARRPALAVPLDRRAPGGLVTARDHR
jgi:enterochelin esterase family protein